MSHKTYFNWSSGKDSALALHYLLQDRNFSVEKLVTTINTHHNRVSMHGLRKELLLKQTHALGLPLQLITLPETPSMAIYEQKMTEAINVLKTEGFTHSAFGDIFLEDLKNYRESQLKKYQLQSVFPLWKKDTKTLLNKFIDLGFKSVIVCASSKYFDKDFVGTVIDKRFINNLPKTVDPCGENGEFHTFCFDGPIFKTPVSFTIGEKVYREYDSPSHHENGKYGVWYGDLLP
ncbi:MAG: diphthine--ammonia ligase [Aestuariibaculum sp.]